MQNKKNEIDLIGTLFQFLQFSLSLFSRLRACGASYHLCCPTDRRHKDIFYQKEREREKNTE